jgi:hypothetical protein
VGTRKLETKNRVVIQWSIAARSDTTEKEEIHAIKSTITVSFFESPQFHAVICEASQMGVIRRDVPDERRTMAGIGPIGVKIDFLTVRQLFHPEVGHLRAIVPPYQSEKDAERRSR